MAEWSLPDLDSPINQFDSYHYASNPSCREHDPGPPVSRRSTPQAQPCLPAANMDLHFAPQLFFGNAGAVLHHGETPREVRNRAEKMRRDRLNQAVEELKHMVPPVVAARRKIDKTTVLRLTAHFLRAHQYVFGDAIARSSQRQRFTPASMQKVLSLFNGFLITTTYKGIVVVVSQNVNEFLGYTELDLLGQNLFNITHEQDRAILRDQLMPRTQTLGPNGELVLPDEPDAIRKAEDALAHEKRRFIIRLKKMGQRSEPSQYVTCHVEGSLRKSDRACRGYNRCCQIVRRARARSENPCSSGNDIVFIGVVRLTGQTLINESALESYRMEYRTRHSIDGEIIQCEPRIALVTGYMSHEVSGVNAMNFMHRDDVRWVIIALREMYDEQRLYGESCYRLITKNGQCIYMRTRGCLEVDQSTRAVTSFVCTNTVVNEVEGRQLIKQMKKKFTLMVNNNEAPSIEDIDNDSYDDKEDDDQPAPVEDPRRLEQVILHLVTNLPSPNESEDESRASASRDTRASSHRLSIIPPNKERIVSAIEKIYDVMKPLQKDLSHNENKFEQSSSGESSHTTPKFNSPTYTNTRQSSHTTPKFNSPTYTNTIAPPQGLQIVPYQSTHVSNYVQAPESSLVQPMGYNVSDSSDAALNNGVSPDLGYFDASSSPFSNLFSNYNQNGEEIFNKPRAKPRVHELNYYSTESAMTVPTPQYSNESDFLQALPQPSTSNSYSCGTKRPNDFEDFDVAYKKKITEVEIIRENEPIAKLESPLDSFFDESVFTNDQIESAISSLDSLDPSFPDLLFSTDVENILEQIEKEAEEEDRRLQGFNLSEYD